MTPRGWKETAKMPTADLTALYDAILLGKRAYIAGHDQCASFVEDADPWDAGALYHTLVRAGSFEDPLRFNQKEPEDWLTVHAHVPVGVQDQLA